MHPFSLFYIILFYKNKKLINLISQITLVAYYMLRAKAQYKISSGGSKMLERLFGNDGFFGAGAWWIIVLFFLFLAFGDSWVDIDIMAWIPFLIVLLILCSCGGFFD